MYSFIIPVGGREGGSLFGLTISFETFAKFCLRDYSID
jgi:hypothetical protein